MIPFKSSDEFIENLELILINLTNLIGNRRIKFWKDTVAEAQTWSCEAELIEKLDELCHDPNFWGDPKRLDNSVSLPSLPEDALPDLPNRYLKAFCAYAQVSREMVPLPMLSVFALCLQGKAIIKNPGTGSLEHLCLYTITVAFSGERKSSLLSCLLDPVYKYTAAWNKDHKLDINNYRTERDTYLKKRALSINKGDVNAAKEMDQKLAALVPVHPMKLIVSDATPEALVKEMSVNDEHMAVMSDEGGIFDILMGAYSKGDPNIKILLDAYDGSPYSVSRISRDDIVLNAPLLTMGLMTQPSQFRKIASRELFLGKGFLQRFLFSHPKSMIGKRSFESQEIPHKVQEEYNRLVHNLLRISRPKSSTLPVLECDKRAKSIFKQYHHYIESQSTHGGCFESICGWSSKHVARALRIAGIYHLVKHGENGLSLKVDEETAKQAVTLASWCEAQAIYALVNAQSNNQTKSNAIKIAEWLKAEGKIQYTKTDIINKFRHLHDANLLNPALELLEENNYILSVTIPPTGHGGRPTTNIYVSPRFIEP